MIMTILSVIVLHAFITSAVSIAGGSTIIHRDGDAVRVAVVFDGTVHAAERPSLAD